MKGNYFFMQPSQLNPNEDPDYHNPARSRVVEQNIRTIIHLRTKSAKNRSPQNRIRRRHPTFVLSGQNRLGEEMERRADQEMETKPDDVLAEIPSPAGDRWSRR